MGQTEEYVLVHVHCIGESLAMHRDDKRHPEYQTALRVAREIGRIKSSKAMIHHVDKGMAYYETPETLPDPHEDLLIKVIGAYTERCVAAQLSFLIQAGYNARVHSPGCLNLPQSFNKDT